MAEMTHDEIMQLDADALRLAIANALGWTEIVLHDPQKPTGLVDWTEMTGYPPNNPTAWGKSHIPLYSRDTKAAIGLLESTGREYNIGKTLFSHMDANDKLERPVYTCVIWDGGGIEAEGEVLALAASRAWLMWEEAQNISLLCE